MTKEKIKVHDTFLMEDLERLRRQKCLADARDYEQTLDTLVEWFGGIVPKSTYRKLREGANEVAVWISVNKGDESSTDS